LHEWQRDTLRAPNANNALIDGDDVNGAAIVATQRIGNYMQTFVESATVSRRADNIKKAGRAKEMAYQVAKKYKELKRDVEARFLSELPAVVGNATTAMQTAGIGVQLYTNALHGAGGSTPAHTAGAPTVAPTAGTARAFTAALLETSLQNTYTNSGSVPDTLFMSPAHKVIASGFVGIAANRVDLEKKKTQGAIISGVDIYASNFGVINFAPHYIMVGSGTVYGLDLDDIDKAYFPNGGFNDQPLAKTGDSEKRMLTVDVAPCVNAEKRHFKIANLTP
jgi:hypothetical protein